MKKKQIWVVIKSRNVIFSVVFEVEWREGGQETGEGDGWFIHVCVTL